MYKQQFEERHFRMDEIHIEKGSVQETLIIPLYGRKLCAEQFPTLYQDKYAAKICESIDYDFSQFKDKEKSAMYQFGALEGAMREKDMLWEIADYLKAHPYAAVVNLGCGLNTLSQLSEELHTSPTAIKSAFKSVYGESIREHMKTLRLQEAQRLIRETEKPMSEIAELVGYSNPGHFAVAFREKFSITPSEYRKQTQNTGRIV